MTTDQAAEEVLRHLTEDEKNAISRTPRNRLAVFHFSLGLIIRNRMGIIESYSRSWDRGLWDDADAESGRVIAALWDLLHIKKKDGYADTSVD